MNLIVPLAFAIFGVALPLTLAAARIVRWQRERAMFASPAFPPCVPVTPPVGSVEVSTRQAPSSAGSARPPAVGPADVHPIEVAA